VIVWSRGLGKQRLPLELKDATRRVTSENLILEGTIEPVCWRYAIRLAPGDLADFLKLMASPEIAKFLAEKPGVLLPFLFGIVSILPRLAFRMFFSRKIASEISG
jgi:hypothetical protein